MVPFLLKPPGVSNTLFHSIIHSLKRILRLPKIKIPTKIGIYISAYSSLEKDILSLTYRTTYICEIDVKVM